MRVQVSRNSQWKSHLYESEDPETYTVTYDEKSGIQAIAATSPDLPSLEGNGITYRGYEYVRHGTLSLLAGRH